MPTSIIVIPTYNEQGNIAELVSQIRAANSEIKILFVDDNSPDRTAEAIKSLMLSSANPSGDKNIGLIIRPSKQGLGSAYCQTFSKIIAENSAEFIITMDADLSHPALTVNKILEQLKNYDLVIGSRYIQGGSAENWNIFRKILSKGANIYARILTKTKIKDLTSGFSGYSTKALRRINLNQISSDGYAFQIEIKQQMLATGATYREIPITFYERRRGKSKLSGQIVLEGILYPPKVFLRNFKQWLPGLL